MPNLVAELSVEYCNDMVRGSVIMYNDEPHMIVVFAEEHMVLAKITPTTTNEDWERMRRGSPVKGQITVPHDVLRDWSSLSFPDLGYRMVGDNNELLMYVVRHHTVRRGLAPRDLSIDYTVATREIINEFYGDNIPIWQTVYACFKPTFMSFDEGIKEVLAGRRSQFAMSPEFAVTPVRESGFLSVLFRGREVGFVNKDGSVKISDKAEVVWKSQQEVLAK